MTVGIKRCFDHHIAVCTANLDPLRPNALQALQYVSAIAMHSHLNILQLDTNLQCNCVHAVSQQSTLIFTSQMSTNDGLDALRHSRSRLSTRAFNNAEWQRPYTGLHRAPMALVWNRSLAYNIIHMANTVSCCFGVLRQHHSIRC
jgi:hypothetical protein